MRPPLPPRAALLSSTALSATYPTTLKLLYAADGAVLAPVSITALRFVLMAGSAQAILRTSNGGDDDSAQDPGLWIAATELGLWAAAGAQLNTAALEQIDVVRGTILLAAVNILTPALSAVIGSDEQRRVLTPRTWTACAVALCSTIFALLDHAAPVDAASASLQLSLGDDLVLGAACCFATQQVRLGTLVAKYPAQQLAAARLQTQALWAGLGVLLFRPGDGSPVTLQSAALWASQLSTAQCGLLIFSACTAVVGLLLQYEGQRTVAAASAQPIYAASPIIAACWAFVVLREPITAGEAVGGLGIGCAALIAATSDEKQKGVIDANSER